MSGNRKLRYLTVVFLFCGLIILFLFREPSCLEIETEDTTVSGVTVEDYLAGSTDDDTIKMEERGTGHRSDAFNQTGIHVAVGGGIISKGVDGLTSATLDKLDFFNTFLPSFCETITNEYHYHLYWGYDFNDPFFSDKLNQTAFIRHTDEMVRKKCPSGVKVPVVFVRCNYTGFPAWAQNDAMYAAYLDGADYFYRINDDTKFITKYWANIFIDNLRKRDPPNMGVVGPLSLNDYTPILSHDFVHKTHVDMLGVYYPRALRTWFADSWISEFYRAEGMYEKLESVTVVHTKQGSYQADKSDRSVKGDAIWCHKSVLKRYESRIGSTTLLALGTSSSRQKRVISFSLFGNQLKYTTGAIRNAQLAPVIFTGWTTRFYIPPKSSSLSVPDNVISKLLELGSEVITVSDVRFQQPKNWRYLVTYDDNVDIFLIRSVDHRLSDREREAVSLWLNSDDFQPVNVIKDLPKHAYTTAGLWGAHRQSLVSSITNSTSSIGTRFRDMIGTADTKQLDMFVYEIFQFNMSCLALDKNVSNQSCGHVKLNNRVRTKCGDVRVGQRYEAFTN